MYNRQTDHRYKMLSNNYIIKVHSFSTKYLSIDEIGYNVVQQWGGNIFTAGAL